MRYFISDLHNYDSNIITYSRRPFKNCEHMRSVIINEWNKTVKGNDQVFLLGDIGDPEIIGYLNGYITVVIGNHDNYDELKNMYPYMEISKYPIMVDGMILSHKPIDFMPPECPYLNVHGHLHWLQYGSEGNWNDGNRYFNVSAERLGYKPMSEEEITIKIGYVRNGRRPRNLSNVDYAE